MEGGGLKENLAPLGNDTARSGGLVGGSVSLWGVGFEVSYAQCHGFLLVACRCRILSSSTTMSACMPADMMITD